MIKLEDTTNSGFKTGNSFTTTPYEQSVTYMRYPPPQKQAVHPQQTYMSTTNQAFHYAKDWNFVKVRNQINLQRTQMRTDPNYKTTQIITQKQQQPLYIPYESWNTTRSQSAAGTRQVATQEQKYNVYEAKQRPLSAANNKKKSNYEIYQEAVSYTQNAYKIHSIKKPNNFKLTQNQKGQAYVRPDRITAVKAPKQQFYDMDIQNEYNQKPIVQNGFSKNNDNYLKTTPHQCVRHTYETTLQSQQNYVFEKTQNRGWQRNNMPPSKQTEVKSFSLHYGCTIPKKTETANYQRTPAQTYYQKMNDKTNNGFGKSFRQFKYASQTPKQQTVVQQNEQ